MWRFKGTDLNGFVLLSGIVLLFRAGEARSIRDPAHADSNSDEEIIDLSYTLEDNTVFWPPLEKAAGFGFRRTSLYDGRSPNGIFFRTGYFEAAEHGGTHIDSPYHFYPTGQDLADIKPDQLVGPAVVLNVSQQVVQDKDYQVSLEDVNKFEKEHGQIASGSFVLMFTGWGRFWPDKQAMYNSDVDDVYNMQSLHFPGFHPDTTRFLIDQRAIKGVGVDTGSIDSAREMNTSATHVVLAQHDLIGIEFLANLDKLPPVGARLMALPIRIVNGSGSPARVIAFVPKVRNGNECDRSTTLLAETTTPISNTTHTLESKRDAPTAATALPEEQVHNNGTIESVHTTTTGFSTANSTLHTISSESA